MSFRTKRGIFESFFVLPNDKRKFSLTFTIVLLYEKDKNAVGENCFFLKICYNIRNYILNHNCKVIMADVTVFLSGYCQECYLCIVLLPPYYKGESKYV